MNCKILFALTLIVLTNLTFAQKNTGKNLTSEKISINGKKYTFNTVDKAVIQSDSRDNSAPMDWEVVMSEDFEGFFPSGNWNVYAVSGYTDAYWGKILLSDNTYAGWCAASGTEASTWTEGYKNNMYTWMFYGPFDLSDASDAYLDVDYNNDLEPDYDTLWITASDNGINYYGYSLVGNSDGWQFFDIDFTDLPGLGNITGRNGIYIGFLFISDVSNPQIYKGTLIDNITVLKFTGTTGSAPTTVTQNATNVTSTSASLNGTVNPNDLSTDVIFEYGTSTAYGNLVTATPSTITGNLNVGVTANITGLQPNTTYHYRVTATNSVGSTSGADATFNTSQGSTYPSSITVSRSFTFANVTQSTSYRLIGLPGNNNLPMSQFFTGEQKKDWNVFYDNGANTDFLVEYNGSATFNFKPGQGFWALSRNPITISERQVNSVSLTGDAFRISLNNGWNIIANPFEKNVSAADIRTANSLAQNSIFYNFTGSFPAAGTTILTPYEGYYFFNDGTRSNLNIPYPYTVGKVQVDDSWLSIAKQNLKISLNSKGGIKDVTIGIDPSSSDNFDEMDYLAPPNYFEDISINLVNQNLSIKYKNLFIEHRPEIGEGQIFNIEIKNKTGERVALSTEGLNNFESYEIYLLDERFNKFYNLRELNRIDISSVHQDNKYSLFIGSKDFINNRKEALAPKEYALYQNYPNPFNPGTIIQYAIPASLNASTGGTLITIKVYDILGNLVTTLVNEVQAPGNYEVEFNGTGLSSGMYIYEINAGNFREVKKMSLLK
jgi:hypothetical protein